MAEPHRMHFSNVFDDAKVGTCLRVMLQGGRNIAVPFSNSRKKLLFGNSDQIEKRSLTHDSFKLREITHAGMMNKPLHRYSPISERSKLRTEDFIIPYKNSSTIVIGDRRTRDKNQFLTTARNMMKKPAVHFSTNPGIISERIKWKRLRQSF